MFPRYSFFREVNAAGLIKRAAFVAVSAVRRSLLTVGLTAAAVCLSGPAQAEPPCEQIERMDVEISVLPDASARVTERIAVQACGEKIQRGIFRILPKKGVSDYEILSVRRNGRPEPYSVQKNSNGQTVYIGDKNSFLAPGRQLYEISYLAFDAVRFQQDFDELYWNVTGSEWQFPIQQASLRLTLPEGAAILPRGISLYTGYENNAGAPDASASGNYFFYTTRPLAPGEGFTVSAAWNKGIVRERSQAEKTRDFLKRNFSGWRNLLLAWLALLVYYVLVWRKIGKDPAPRVVRRFTPPEGLSPAQTRYIWKMKCDAEAFPVTVLSLAQKDCLQVEEKSKGNFSLRRGPMLPPADLPYEEQALLTVLFAAEDQVEVCHRNSPIFKSARQTLRQALACWEGGRYFKRNSWANIPTVLFAGWLLWRLLPAVQETILFQHTAQLVLFFSLWGYMMFGYLFRKRFPKIFVRKYFGLVWLAVFLVLLLGPVMAGCAAVLLAPGAVFFVLVRAYTAQGRERMNEIEGFLQYLKTAEKYRVFASNPTDASRIYCDYLPYATALDVQSKWQKAFQQEMGKAALQEVENLRGFAFSHWPEVFVACLAAVALAPAVSRGGSGFGGCGRSGGGSGGGGGGW